MEADECVLVLLIGEGGIGHAGELLVEDVLVVLERWIEKLVEGGGCGREPGRGTPT